MTSLFEAVPYLAAYRPSFAILALLVIVTIVQAILCVPLAFLKKEQTPGLPLKLDHSSLSFRVMRTYSNTVETLPIFGFALLAASAAGTSPALVNWLAGIYLAFRLLYWAVYYSGIGRASGGPRSMCFIGAMTANAVLAVAALITLF
ncbi:MAPEG family protein [Roseibium algae]|uniref:MAPEG family protein n=1 Tax=Roseibium algae TaxID=3123038 RepID=A0ABU8TGB8_9HYPH